MAAPCTRLARSALLKGSPLARCGSLLWTQTSQKTAAVPLCLRLAAAVGCRPLHLSSAGRAAASGTKVHPQQSTEPQKKTGAQKDGKKEEEEEEEYDGPEYIPRRKAKNPMVKIGYAWMIGLPTGIIGFVLAKREVDKNRLKQLRIRQRMKKSNEGDYDRSRYLHHSETAELGR